MDQAERAFRRTFIKRGDIVQADVGGIVQLGRLASPSTAPPASLVPAFAAVHARLVEIRKTLERPRP